MIMSGGRTENCVQIRLISCDSTEVLQRKLETMNEALTPLENESVIAKIESVASYTFQTSTLLLVGYMRS